MTMRWVQRHQFAMSSIAGSPLELRTLRISLVSVNTVSYLRDLKHQYYLVSLNTICDYYSGSQLLLLQNVK